MDDVASMHGFHFQYLKHSSSKLHCKMKIMDSISCYLRTAISTIGYTLAEKHPSMQPSFPRLLHKWQQLLWVPRRRILLCLSSSLLQFHQSVPSINIIEVWWEFCRRQSRPPLHHLQYQDESVSLIFSINYPHGTAHRPYCYRLPLNLTLSPPICRPAHVY